MSQAKMEGSARNIRGIVCRYMGNRRELIFKFEVCRSPTRAVNHDKISYGDRLCRCRSFDPLMLSNGCSVN